MVDLGLPSGLLIILIARGNEFVQPKGATQLAAGDTLLVLAEAELFEQARALAAGESPPAGPGETGPASPDGASGSAGAPGAAG